MAIEEFKDASYRQLQTECGMNGLRAVGGREVLRKRLADHYESQQTKRQKKYSKVTDGMTCPITKVHVDSFVSSCNNRSQASLACALAVLQVLLFSPVTAEDGNLYEEYAIKRIIENSPHEDKVKSPVTNELMGKKLLPSRGIKNHIQCLLECDIIEGDMADEWWCMFFEKEEFDDLCQQASEGREMSPSAMVRLAEFYMDGNEDAGIPKDWAKAAKIYENLHDMGNPRGTALLGEMLYKGQITPSNVQKGISYLTMAAENKSDIGAYNLAKVFHKPRAGLAADIDEARKHYELAIELAQDETNPHRTLTEEEVWGIEKTLNRLQDS